LSNQPAFLSTIRRKARLRKDPRRPPRGIHLIRLLGEECGDSGDLKIFCLCFMMMTGTKEVFMHLIIQLISGALGGVGAGGLMKKLSLGTIGNSIAGILGGGIGGQLLGLLGMAPAAGSGDLGGIISSILGGGVGGGVLMAIIGAIKKALVKK
jgi:uncharacterized membrane protein YeaQ/YmgE (transglycosylase-associated protein family)